MIYKEVFMMQKWVVGVWLFLGFMCGACSRGTEELLPPSEENVPGDAGDVVADTDTLDIRIGYSISVGEEFIKTRAGSRDLIGVQIYRLNAQGLFWRESYSCGVFDDLDKMVFKMVKGDRYLIQMNYYPDAKDIVYNYPDGTFGNPFSSLYGLKSYKINEPVYFSGVDGDGSSGDIGAELVDLFSCLYQPTDDRYSQSFKRGMTSCYLGELEEVKIEDDTQIVVELQLCMMGITLNVDNFTEGELNMTFEHVDWHIKPGDDLSILFQIPYNYLVERDSYYYDRFDSGEYFRLFYTNGKGEKYLLATKALAWRPGVNHVFSFELTERSDGSIGIKMPGDEKLEDEESFFD